MSGLQRIVVGIIALALIAIAIRNGPMLARAQCRANMAIWGPSA
jgi:hypothetical protein